LPGAQGFGAPAGRRAPGRPARGGAQIWADLAGGIWDLGFNVRRYQRKLVIKPSQAAIKRLWERLAAETRRLRGLNAVADITALSPVIRGWAA
jgi:hypothetical protein